MADRTSHARDFCEESGEAPGGPIMEEVIMGNYLSKEDWKDPKTLAAIQALTEANPSIRDRIFAEVTADEDLSDFVKSRNLKVSKSHCIMRLLGKQCGAVYYKPCKCRPPGDDHGMMFNLDGKAFCYVSQPYQVSQETAKEMVAFAERYNLQFHIATWPAWHFPSGTVSVVWTRKGEYASPIKNEGEAE